MNNQGVPLSPAVRAVLSIRGEFLVGKQVESNPGDVQSFRKQMINFIQNQGFGTIFGNSPLQDRQIAPYREAFAQRRAETLAQTKEGVGNLVGSGFANAYGSAAGRSVGEENAFLGQLQQQNADRFLKLLQVPQGYVGQMTHQPGFLDYAAKGVQMAAPFFL